MDSTELRPSHSPETVLEVDVSKAYQIYLSSQKEQWERLISSLEKTIEENRAILSSPSPESGTNNPWNDPAILLSENERLTALLDEARADLRLRAQRLNWPAELIAELHITHSADQAFDVSDTQESCFLKASALSTRYQARYIIPAELQNLTPCLSPEVLVATKWEIEDNRMMARDDPRSRYYEAKDASANNHEGHEPASDAHAEMSAWSPEIINSIRNMLDSPLCSARDTRGARMLKAQANGRSMDSTLRFTGTKPPADFYYKAVDPCAECTYCDHCDPNGETQTERQELRLCKHQMAARSIQADEDCTCSKLQKSS